MKEEKDVSDTMYISMKFPISRGAVYGKHHFNMGREGKGRKEGEGRGGEGKSKSLVSVYIACFASLNTVDN